MIAVGMDGFHLTKAELNKMPDPAAAFARRGSPWTFNPSEMASLLVSVRGAAGITDITWPDFQHGTGDPVPDVHLIRPNVKILLVEGLYLLYREHGWDKVSGQFDESWFLNTPMEVSMDRLVRRHMATSGQSIEIAENRIASNDRLNAEIVARTRSYSNFMLEDVQKPLNST
jgi:pantothenate kinase